MIEKRIVWMDCARGAAILLVILSHSVTQLRFGFEVPPALTKISDAFSPFRMPLLAFLSGILVHLSLRKERWTFFTGKAKNLLWPYAVWTIVCAFTAGAKYGPTDHEFYISYLWYILYLFFFYIAAYLVRTIPKIPIILSALALAAIIPADLDTPRRFFYLLAIFFLGHLAHESGHHWIKLVKNRWNWILVIPATAASIVAGSGEGVRYSPTWTAAALSGVILICSVSSLVMEHSSKRILCNITSYLSGLGRNSLVYYVSHFPIIYGVIILCSELGGPLWIAFPAAMAAALLCGSALVALRSRSIIINSLFTFPSWSKTQPSTRKGRYLQATEQR